MFNMGTAKKVPLIFGNPHVGDRYRGYYGILGDQTIAHLNTSELDVLRVVFSDHSSQRVHVGIWYILRAQRNSQILTLRPKYIPLYLRGPFGVSCGGSLGGWRTLGGFRPHWWVPSFSGVLSRPRPSNNSTEEYLQLTGG